MNYSISIETVDAFNSTLVTDGETESDFDKRRKLLIGTLRLSIYIKDLATKELKILQGPCWQSKSKKGGIKALRSTINILNKLLISRETKKLQQQV
jgi:hypothetical protein